MSLSLPKGACRNTHRLAVAAVATAVAAVAETVAAASGAASHQQRKQHQYSKEVKSCVVLILIHSMSLSLL